MASRRRVKSQWLSFSTSTTPHGYLRTRRPDSTVVEPHTANGTNCCARRRGGGGGGGGKKKNTQKHPGQTRRPHNLPKKTPPPPPRSGCAHICRGAAALPHLLRNKTPIECTEDEVQNLQVSLECVRLVPVLAATPARVTHLQSQVLLAHALLVRVELVRGQLVVGDAGVLEVLEHLSLSGLQRG